MTRNEVVAVSGSVVTVPLPVTLIVPGRASVLSARINAGAPTPARAEATSSVAVIQTRRRSLIAVSYGARRDYVTGIAKFRPR